MSEVDEPGGNGKAAAEPLEGPGFPASDEPGAEFSPEMLGTVNQIDTPAEATPLEDDEPEGTVPPSPLWAMKDHRHEQWVLFGHAERIRRRIGDGDDAVYVIDDGKHHCMLGRPVGESPGGVVYSLVARADRATYDDLANGAVDGAGAFARSSEAALMGTVDEGDVANVFEVETYRAAADIPDEYLPRREYIHFPDDLPLA